MSVQAITKALELRGIKPTEKLVLLALANYADEQMRCWPSQDRLADDCCMTGRTIRTALSGLEKRGIIARSPRRRPDGYRAADLISLHISEEKFSPENISPENRVRSHRKNPSISPENISPLTSLEPIKEPSREPSKMRERVLDGFEEFWSMWPDKRSKGAARKAYPKARSIASAAEILAGVPYVDKTQAWLTGYRVHASKWLNEERWADEPDTAARAPPATGGMMAAASDELAFRVATGELPRDVIERNPGRNQGTVIALSQASAIRR